MAPLHLMEEWSFSWEMISMQYYSMKTVAGSWTFCIDVNICVMCVGEGDTWKDRLPTGGLMEEDGAWSRFASQILNSLHIELFETQLKKKKKTHPHLSWAWSLLFSVFLSYLCFVFIMFPHFYFFPLPPLSLVGLIEFGDFFPAAVRKT